MGAGDATAAAGTIATPAAAVVPLHVSSGVSGGGAGEIGRDGGAAAAERVDRTDCWGNPTLYTPTNAARDSSNSIGFGACKRLYLVVCCIRDGTTPQWPTAVCLPSFYFPMRWRSTMCDMGFMSFLLFFHASFKVYVCFRVWWVV